MATPTPCPGCGQNAPIVLRGVDAYCTVCSARRTPFAGDILNLAGEPARIGGVLARIAGWGALAVGLFVALAAGLVVQAVASMFSPVTWLGWAVGVPIAVLAVVLGLTGILGGRKLDEAGQGRLRDAQRATVHALARHHGGIVTVAEAGRALGVDEPRADAVLTALAREPAENVSIDVDDDGTVRYLFGSAPAIRWRIQAERAGITDTERVELERELERMGTEGEQGAARMRRG